MALEVVKITWWSATCSTMHKLRVASPIDQGSDIISTSHAITPLLLRDGQWMWWSSNSSVCWIKWIYPAWDRVWCSTMKLRQSLFTKQLSNANHLRMEAMMDFPTPPPAAASTAAVRTAAASDSITASLGPQSPPLAWEAASKRETERLFWISHNAVCRLDVKAQCYTRRFHSNFCPFLL